MHKLLQDIKRSLREYAFFTIVAFLPTIIWAAVVWVPEDGVVSMTFRAIAKICAFSAIGTFLVTPMLSCRIRIIDKLCGGLDRAYTLHRWMAKASMVFAVLHVYFLVLYAISSKKIRVPAIFDLGNISVALGILALAGSLVLVGLAIYSKVKHQKWIKIHRLFAITMIAAWGHVLLASGDARNNPLLWWSVAILGVFSLAGWAIRLFSGTLVNHFKYEVAEVHEVDEHVTELVLRPLGEQVHYYAGQYAWLSIEDPAVDKEAHPFSFATSDNGRYVRFTIKKLGDYTNNIANISPGAKAEVEGPFGNMHSYAKKGQHQVWIAGGIGIAPFLSMARGLDTQSSQQITLMYAFKEAEDAAFYNELTDIQGITQGRFTVVPVEEVTAGFVDLEKIKKCTPDIMQTEFMICGPPVMMNSIIKQLTKEGVKRSRIHGEEFSL